MGNTTYRIFTGKENYLLIDVSQLKAGCALPFDIYVKDLNIIKYLFNKGTVFPENASDYLRKKSIKQIYILSSDSAVFEEYLNSNILNETIPDKLDLITAKDYAYFKDKFHQIDRSVLFPGAEISFGVYARKDFKINIIAKPSDGSPFRINEQTLQSSGELLIKTQDMPLYQQYLNSLLNLKDDLVFKSRVIKENSKVIMRDLLADPRSGEKLKKSLSMVNSIIECISGNGETLFDLLSLRNYDYYTYTHSVNVSVLSIGLGMASGLGPEEIETLGIGAMLHDIGKSVIPPEILNKKDKLSEDEFSLMKSHVEEGENILTRHINIPHDVLIPVSQHHEKLSGKGYPKRLAADDIAVTGRITAIVDCYDALTTQRPYKKAFTPYEALELIKKEADNFDPELLKSFVIMLGGIKNTGVVGL